MISEFELLVIAGDWPGQRSGLQWALASSLRLLTREFPKVHFIGIHDGNPSDEQMKHLQNVSWHHAKISKQSPATRFVRSLPGKFPAVCLRYRDARRSVLAHARRIFNNAELNGRKILVVIEDITPACLIPSLKKHFGDVPIATRSHNMITKGFAGLAEEGAVPEKLAWTYETKRIRAFEKEAAGRSDCFWCISSAEVDLYRDMLGVTANGVMGISLPADRYHRVGPGDTKTLVHVGSADLRKGRGLIRFIETGWKIIKHAVPDAKFLLAGRDTKRFNCPALGIFGLGEVDQDTEILEQGQIFINPQMIGAGIKVKSVIAMLAGRTLVSTREGVSGVPGADHVHFLISENEDELAQKVMDVMLNEKKAHILGNNARTLATDHFSFENFRNNALPVLYAFVDRAFL